MRGLIKMIFLKYLVPKYLQTNHKYEKPLVSLGYDSMVFDYPIYQAIWKPGNEFPLSNIIVK